MKHTTFDGKATKCTLRHLLLACSAGLSLFMLHPSVSAAAQSWDSAYLQGEGAMTQGKLSAAEESFRTALRLVSTQSDNPADTEKCMLKLADTLALETKTAEAQQIYQKLLGILTKRYGDNNNQIVPVLFALGSIQESAGNHTTAITYYQRALKINESKYGPYSPSITDSLRKLGQASRKAGNKEDAKKHYKRAIDILSKEASLRSSSEMESLLHDYNDLLTTTDDSNRELIQDFQKDIFGGSDKKTDPQQDPPSGPKQPSSWQRQEQTKLAQLKQSQTNEDPEIVLRGPIGQSDQSLQPAFKTIATSIFREGRYEQGEENYKRTIATDIDALGPNHPAVANDLIGLANLYINQERYADAAPLLTRALNIYEQAYGKNNVLAIRTQATLAAAQFHLGNTDKAAELFRSALNHGQSFLGPNSLETANILNQLAFLYFEQGKLQEAATFYEWALASTEGSVGEHDPLMAACLQDYAQVLRAMGRKSEADAMEARAGKILSASK